TATPSAVRNSIVSIKRVELPFLPLVRRSSTSTTKPLASCPVVDSRCQNHRSRTNVNTIHAIGAMTRSPNNPKTGDPICMLHHLVPGPTPVSGGRRPTPTPCPQQGTGQPH